MYQINKSKLNFVVFFCKLMSYIICHSNDI